MKLRTPQNLRLEIEQLEGLDVRMIGAAAEGLKRGLVIVAGKVKRDYLSGPRPTRLDVRTTRLRNSIATEVQTNGSTITGTIGTNVSYGAFHEFGFQGTVNVAAHTRAVAAVSKGGAPINLQERKAHVDKLGRFIGFKESAKDFIGRLGKKVAVAGIQSVKAHQRRLNYKGRPFVRPALLESTDVLTREINRSLAAAKGGSNG